MEMARYHRNCLALLHCNALVWIEAYTLKHSTIIQTNQYQQIKTTVDENSCVLWDKIAVSESGGENRFISLWERTAGRGIVWIVAYT